MGANSSRDNVWSTEHSDWHRNRCLTNGSYCDYLTVVMTKEQLTV